MARVAIMALALAVAGCVSVERVQNWQPQNDTTQQAYHECLREAQQPHPSSGAASSRVAGTNHDRLCSCMVAKGYRLREPSTTETVAGWATAPVWVPLFFAAKIGEGVTGKPPQNWIGCP
jgi:hypothetical protein